MKIKILQDCVVPNMPAFTAGQECDIIESVATTLCQRGLALAEKVETAKETKSDEDKNSKRVIK